MCTGILKYILFLKLISQIFSLCYKDCKKCSEAGIENDMKCTSCYDDSKILVNTSNCVKENYYPDYYVNQTDFILYPCSIFSDSHCYECDPYLNNKGICLSCEHGYEYNEETNECKKCKENDLTLTIPNFVFCHKNSINYCYLYTTLCYEMGNNIIFECPEASPFYRNVTKSCSDNECQKDEIKSGICLILNEKVKNKLFFINWFYIDKGFIGYPSYNIDESGYLLIELFYDEDLKNKKFNFLTNSNKRKMFFLNEEGRGFFNDITDIYEKNFNIRKPIQKLFSVSTAIRDKDSEKYKFYLSIENYNYNLIIMDLDKGKITVGNFLELCKNYYAYKIQNIFSPSIQIIELKEKNQILIASYIYERTNVLNLNYQLGIF